MDQHEDADTNLIVLEPTVAVHNSDLHALPIAPPPMTASRTSHFLATPKPSVPRGSVPLSMTTPSFSQHSTLRKPSRLNSVLASPAPHNFTQIPQTPKTGMIKGLGISGSSVKLTSSQSIRGDFGTKFGTASSSMMGLASDPRATPLAVRRRN